MKKYIGTKQIQAKPMTRSEYHVLRGWAVENDDDGYLVVYPDSKDCNVQGFNGYVSWFPKEVFEAAYKTCETFKDRLQIERDELQERLHKLGAFLGSDLAGIEIDDYQYNLLHEQEQAMGMYLEILNKHWLVA